MAEIISVGVAFLDNVFEADFPASEDSKTFARGHKRFGGGMAATAAVAIAQLGGRASLWTTMRSAHVFSKAFRVGAYKPTAFDGSATPSHRFLPS